MVIKREDMIFGPRPPEAGLGFWLDMLIAKRNITDTLHRRGAAVMRKENGAEIGSI